MNVVDSSVSVKWVYAEPGTPEAIGVLNTEPGLTAPALWRLETANALLRKGREGRLSDADLRSRIDYLAALPLVLVEDADLLGEAVGLSLQLRHPVYDCLYLALALREGSCVLTADRPFARVASRSGYAGSVRLIGPDQP